MKKKFLNYLIIASLGSTVLPGTLVFADEAMLNTFPHEHDTSSDLEMYNDSDFNTQSIFTTISDVETVDEVLELPIEEEISNQIPDEEETPSTDQDQWIHFDYNQFVAISNDSYSFWDSFTSENRRPTTDYLNKTFKTTAKYQNESGETLLSLYDHQNQWLGYLNEKATTLVGEQGVYQPYEKFVTIRHDVYSLWDSFEWNNGTKTTNYKNKTFKALAKYEHFSGETYLSLYDNQNQWLGYLNEQATTLVKEQGLYQSYERYVTITSDTHALWDSFEWSNSLSTTNYKNKTFKALAKYEHFSGETYLSLYDNQNQWLGYMNERGTTLGSGQQGIYQGYGKYVTIKSNAYAIWGDFSWTTKASGSFAKKTYLAKGVYQHYNGSRYLSLYDYSDKWIGYINEDGINVSEEQQGKYQSYDQLVRVHSATQPIWKSFNFNERTSAQQNNKIYSAKGYYNHFNGSRYLSLYYGNKWVGYINEYATSKVRGAGSFLETSRNQLVSELTTHKNIYLGTPYKSLSSAPHAPERLMVPIGRPNGRTPGFNCTGFVAAAIRNAGGNLKKITNVTSGWGTSNNAYNWRDALIPRTDSISFNTISDLLKSGLAKKGDIIYLEADFSKPGFDCHIGIFWGETSTDNTFWHSTIAGGGNNITNIFSGTPYSKAILIPMD